MRRSFTRRAALGAGISTLGIAAAAPAEPRRDRTWVVIELAGGADALSLVVPYRDPWYYRARRTTAIAPPGVGEGRSIPIDDRFALHPCLAELEPMFVRGELAIALAIGSSDVDRSHRSARAAMRRTLFSTLAGGREEEPTREFDRPSEPEQASDRLALAERVRHAARDARAGDGPRVRIVPAEGWDTHVAQGDGAHGRLSARVHELGSAISAFRREAGDDLNRVALLVVSEFGRSLHETPMRGTDDGHAGVCFLIGDGVGGGRVLGQWPGLDPDALSERRFLAPTTSLRDLLETIEPRTGAPPP